MEKLAIFLSNRRAWAFIVSGFMAILTLVGVAFPVDQQSLVEVVADLGQALGEVIVAGLALWSLIKPKLVHKDKGDNPIVTNK